MQSLLESYLQTRNRTVELSEKLLPEDHVVQADVFVSPTKWHLAHTTWFWESFILCPYLTDYKVFHPDFSFLFNSYYNNVGERVNRIDRGLMTRPVLAEVLSYRAYVDVAMQKLLENNSVSELEELVLLGINHEQQHQELILTDIKYTLYQNPLFPAYDKDCMLLNAELNTEDGFNTIDEGVYKIGFQGKGFAFDNEFGLHQYYLNSFSIAKNLVTNAEYLAFVEDGGYENFNLWLDEGWAWLNENKISKPLYWIKKDNAWHQYTLKGLMPLQANEVLKHVSYYEANAFANWKAMRLPTEQEWEVASSQLNWGTRWEWTSSAYQPYPGFKKAEGAVGEYNGKFMVNQMVLRGASIATARGHSRNTYRNFFHPDARWQFTGIRLVK